jgi:predicted metal-dependent phosphoesterase TrpH
VVRLARDAGLRAFALTDHDTVDGLEEAIQAGGELGVEVVPGVEISARFTGDTMHILGYFLEYKSGELDARLTVLKAARAERNPQIIAKLNALGIPVTMEQVRGLSGGGQVGRPHIARALLEGRYVKTFQEAFDRYLKRGRPAYVEKFRFPPEEAINMIREAKGIPVLAHPFTLGLGSATALQTLLQNLKSLGLAGIEVFYSDHSREQEALYLKQARELDLLVTGGSDFHGQNKPEISLGRFPSQYKLTYPILESLKNWHSREYGKG